MVCTLTQKNQGKRWRMGTQLDAYLTTLSHQSFDVIIHGTVDTRSKNTIWHIKCKHMLTRVDDEYTVHLGGGQLGCSGNGFGYEPFLCAQTSRRKLVKVNSNNQTTCFSQCDYTNNRTTRIRVQLQKYVKSPIDTYCMSKCLVFMHCHRGRPGSYVLLPNMAQELHGLLVKNFCSRLLPGYEYM